MIIRNGAGFRMTMRMLVARNWLAVLVILGVEIGAFELHVWLPALQSSAFSEAGVGVLAGAVGVFLSFRFYEAYGRWWEARTLWGGVVNSSRTFARQVLSYLQPGVLAGDIDPASLPGIHRELVHAQIAWVNALRLGLRREDAFPELDALLAPHDAQTLHSARNVPSQLLRLQSEKLARILDGGTAGQLVLSRLDATLTDLTNLQGGAERIKNTAFPDRVVQASRILVWAVAVLVAVAFIDPIDRVYLLEFIAVLLIVMSFKLVGDLGEELTDPFENRPNDTPMTALCRTIEIDLRQMLGESDLPEPLEPVDGVLM
jgi:putative membrane protein